MHFRWVGSLLISYSWIVFFVHIGLSWSLFSNQLWKGKCFFDVFYSFWRVCLEAAVLDEYWFVLGESVWGSFLLNSFFGQKNSLQISLSWVNLGITRSWINSCLLMSFGWGSAFLISWFDINLNKHLRMSLWTVNFVD